MDRVRRLSLGLLAEHRSEFGEDFANNKQALDDLSIIRSKGLKNEIAGYITKVVKNEMQEIKDQEVQEQARAKENEEKVQRYVATNSESSSNADDTAATTTSVESDDSSDTGIVIHDADDIATPVNDDTAPTDDTTDTTSSTAPRTDNDAVKSTDAV